MADPDPVVEGVFTSFVKDQQWKLADIPDNAEDRHAASFIRRRATTLLAENPSWRTDLAKLNARLTDEVGEVRRYLADKLGTRKARGPLYGGAGDATPKHLDLADLARRKTNEQATTLAAALANPKGNASNRRVNAYLELRRTRVTSIVWRAAALHSALWGAVGQP